MVRLAVILLVDRQGRVLLQERDEHAPRAPDQWGMVGGHVEDGEAFEQAAYRELAEETGLHLAPGELTAVLADRFAYSDGVEGDYRVYGAHTGLTDADIRLGEGRRIVFVSPTELPDLDLAPSSRYFLPRFLDSPFYRGAHPLLRPSVPPGEERGS